MFKNGCQRSGVAQSAAGSDGGPSAVYPKASRSRRKAPVFACCSSGCGRAASDDLKIGQPFPLILLGRRRLHHHVETSGGVALHVAPDAAALKGLGITPNDCRCCHRPLLPTVSEYGPEQARLAVGTITGLSDADHTGNRGVPDEDELPAHGEPTHRKGRDERGTQSFKPQPGSGAPVGIGCTRYRVCRA